MLSDFLVFKNYLPWVLLVIPAGVAIIFVFLRTNRALNTWFHDDEPRVLFPVLRMILRGSGILLLAVALLGPYGGRLPEKINRMGREVYILLDVSASMMAEDIKPSRLSKIKKELKKMVMELKGDKLGLIVFTSDAYVQCPLTTDYKAVLLFIDLVSSEQFSNTGTDFRTALSLALKRFTETEKNSKKVARSIVLISDGEDFGDTYTSVTERLKSEDIMLFTVGVGTYEGARVPNIRNGNVRGYKRNSDGSPAISQLNDASLQEMAEDFGTQYHRIDKPGDDLGPVIDQVKLVSSSVMDSGTELAKVNRFQIPLLLGFLVLAASMFLMPIRPRSAESNVKNP